MKALLTARNSLCPWTHGESNPDLFHAMESFYRYTMGPIECAQIYQKNSRLRRKKKTLGDLN